MKHYLVTIPVILVQLNLAGMALWTACEVWYSDIDSFWVWWSILLAAGLGVLLLLQATLRIMGMIQVVQENERP